MRYSKSALLIALAAGLTACSWKRTPVPLYSDSGSSALVGDWSGGYTSDESGRNGSISFQLASVNDTAYGDVIMVPARKDAYVPSQEQPRIAASRNQGTAEPLKIRFVRMDGNRVSGTLASYKDPDCGCPVVTTFEGRFTNANLIEGTFHTRGVDPGHIPANGTWKVFRQAVRTANPED